METFHCAFTKSVPMPKRKRQIYKSDKTNTIRFLYSFFLAKLNQNILLFSLSDKEKIQMGRQRACNKKWQPMSYDVTEGIAK